MKKRMITILVSLLIFIPVIFLGGMAFEFFVFLIATITMCELIAITGNKLFSFEGIMSIIAMLTLVIPDNYYQLLSIEIEDTLLFYFAMIMVLATTIYKYRNFNFEKAGALVLGALYIGIGYNYLLVIRDFGISMIMLVLLIIWSTDTCAYLGGRLIGQRKLAPHVSPNKTIEGALSGIAGAVIISIIYTFYYNPLNFQMNDIIILAAILSVIGQIGDLVESSLKRHYQVKDSGNLLPGHGGFLDRFDSLLFVLPTFHLIISMF